MGEDQLEAFRPDKVVHGGGRSRVRCGVPLVAGVVPPATVQGDHSGCFKPPVDFKTNVPF